jgi:hypothetical protein
LWQNVEIKEEEEINIEVKVELTAQKSSNLIVVIILGVLIFTSISGGLIFKMWRQKKLNSLSLEPSDFPVKNTG